MIVLKHVTEPKTATKARSLLVFAGCCFCITIDLVAITQLQHEAISNDQPWEWDNRQERHLYAFKNHDNK